MTAASLLPTTLELFIPPQAPSNYSGNSDFVIYADAKQSGCGRSDPDDPVDHMVLLEFSYALVTALNFARAGYLTEHVAA